MRIDPVRPSIDLETAPGRWPPGATFSHRHTDHFGDERLAEPTHLGVNRGYRAQRATGAADNKTAVGPLHLRKATHKKLTK